MILVAAAAAAAALGLSLGVYPYYIEPIWLKTVKVPLTVSTTQGKTLRVIHVSDFHWGDFVSPKYLRRAFRTIAEQKPDVILITGDFINKKVGDGKSYTEALSILSRAAPTYAVPGNHDGGHWAQKIGGYATTDSIREVLVAAGIRYLENAYDCPELRGVRVCIAGTGDPWAQSHKPGLFIGDFDSARADLKIFMMHNPDVKESVRDNDWDILLAGHTHGGQVDIPFLGAPWVQVADKSQVSGLYAFAGRPLYINPGVGSSQRRLRMNCRPEISVLEVKL
jgi:predicted MPP superfamily phosphohydrolase